VEFHISTGQSPVRTYGNRRLYLIGKLTKGNPSGAALAQPDGWISWFRNVARMQRATNSRHAVTRNYLARLHHVFFSLRPVEQQVDQSFNRPGRIHKGLIGCSTGVVGGWAGTAPCQRSRGTARCRITPPSHSSEHVRKSSPPFNIRGDFSASRIGHDILLERKLIIQPRFIYTNTRFWCFS
jgi:hypothetical protein